MWGWYVGKFTSKCARIAEIEVSHGGPQEIFTSKCAKMVEIEVSHGGPQEPKDHRKLKQTKWKTNDEYKNEGA